nr:vegetative cell wall protein gp1-like [Lolium perenne]
MVSSDSQTRDIMHARTVYMSSKVRPYKRKHFVSAGLISVRLPNSPRAIAAAAHRSPSRAPPPFAVARSRSPPPPSARHARARRRPRAVRPPPSARPPTSATVRRATPAPVSPCTAPPSPPPASPSTAPPSPSAARLLSAGAKKLLDF